MTEAGDIRAFLASSRDGEGERGIGTIATSDLGEGDVLVRVAYSSVNYKDALATIPKGQVARISPLVPGIDLAGTVVEAPAGGDLSAGDDVLAHGYDLGVAHHGGYAELARVPAEWLVPLPDGLSARQAMAIGTAGYTAALCVHRLEEHGLAPAAGPSGKSAEGFLTALGAREVISREDAAGDPGRPLGKQRWAAAVDCVGGAVLAGVLTSLRYGGAVAACGNTGGMKLETTVLPLILRAVSLYGIDSVNTPIATRREIWRRLADDLRPPGLDETIAREIGLDDVENALEAILRGELTGRTVVRVG
jgi:acrylyl-CoA reductase (NADPH)